MIVLSFSLQEDYIIEQIDAKFHVFVLVVNMLAISVT
jgi:hypothetical protein